MSEEIKPAALLLTVSALLSRERERVRERGGWGGFTQLQTQTPSPKMFGLPAPRPCGAERGTAR